ncbi:unnamed protein product, partial [Protopolystoma xenopodis]
MHREFFWLNLYTFDSAVLKARLFQRALVAFSLDGIQFTRRQLEMRTTAAQHLKVVGDSLAGLRVGSPSAPGPRDLEAEESEHFGRQGDAYHDNLVPKEAGENEPVLRHEAVG